MTERTTLFQSLLEENAVTVLKDFLGDWPLCSLDIEELAKQSDLEFERVKIKTGTPYVGGKVPRESDCIYREENLKDFCLSLHNHEFAGDELFHYVAYKHMIHMKTLRNYLPNFSWSWAGLPERSANETTLWIGSPDSFTPVHKDTYGCNLHVQVQGRKEWLLWPPDYDLGATRVPYEESSVFSSLDVRGDAEILGDALRIVLEPGEAIFVPKHWWHLVTALQNCISVNTWVDLPCDAIDRVSEAITRLVVCGLHAGEPPGDWVNPGEELSTAAENALLLERAVGMVPGGVAGRRVKPNTSYWVESWVGGERCKHELGQRDSCSSGGVTTRKSDTESGSSVVERLANGIVADPTILESLVGKFVVK